MKRIQVIIGVLATVLGIGALHRPAAAENVLRWASATEPLTFDPHAANHFPTAAANLQVYEPLVDFNSSYEIEPSLATAWRLLDPTTWQFDLRQGVRFHDGAPFTSEDAGRSSMTRCCRPPTARMSPMPSGTPTAPGRSSW